VVALDVLNEKQLFQFVGKYAGDHLRVELLAFWSRHPHDKFTASVISCALDHSKLEVKRALKLLDEAGLVDTFSTGGLTLYNLTTNETN